MLVLTGGLNFLHERGVPQRYQTGILLFADLTTRKQVEAFSTAYCSSAVNADCSPTPHLRKSLFHTATAAAATILTSRRRSFVGEEEEGEDQRGLLGGGCVK